MQDKELQTLLDNHKEEIFRKFKNLEKEFLSASLSFSQSQKEIFEGLKVAIHSISSDDRFTLKNAEEMLSLAERAIVDPKILDLIPRWRASLNDEDVILPCFLANFIRDQDGEKLNQTLFNHEYEKFKALKSKIRKNLGISLVFDNVPEEYHQLKWRFDSNSNMDELNDPQVFKLFQIYKECVDYQIHLYKSKSKNDDLLSNKQTIIKTMTGMLSEGLRGNLRPRDILLKFNEYYTQHLDELKTRRDANANRFIKAIYKLMSKLGLGTLGVTGAKLTKNISSIFSQEPVLKSTTTSPLPLKGASSKLTTK